VKPTVTVPARASPPPFEATFTITEPLPLPLAPDAIVIHGAFAVELHEQSLSVDTLIETLPPV